MPTPEEIAAAKIAEEEKVAKEVEEKAKHSKLRESDKEDLILEIDKQRKENKEWRLSFTDLEKKFDVLNKKNVDEEEKKKIEDGKLQEVLADYKVNNEKLKTENDKFHVMIDKKTEISIEKLTDAQKTFYEGLNYFQKLEFLDNVVETTQSLPPDNRRQSQTSLESQHEALMKKYTETGDEEFYLKANVLEKQMLKKV